MISEDIQEIRKHLKQAEDDFEHLMASLIIFKKPELDSLLDQIITSIIDANNKCQWLEASIQNIKKKL